jgi:hypothetical protein
MDGSPKRPRASRLRRRKFEPIRRFYLPHHLLPGFLCLSRTRCGKPSCHCASGEGHPSWSLTVMANGKMANGRKRVERIPKEWAEEVRRRVAAGREFQDAVKQVPAANAELLALRRKQKAR